MCPYTEMTLKISTQDGIEPLLARKWNTDGECPRKVFVQVIKYEILFSFQTVLTMYDQEMGWKSSNAKLSKIEDDVHIDQMTRTRNVKGPEWNHWDRSTGSHREWRVSVDRRSGRMLSLESNWTVFKRRVLCSCQPQRTNRGQKAQSPSLAPKARTQTDGREPLERFGSQETHSFWKKWAESKAKKSSKESVRIRRVIIGILPYVKITSLCRDAHSADQCLCRHTEADGQPISRKVEEKWWESISCLAEGVYTIGLCVPRLLCRERSLLRDSWKIGSNHTVKFSNGTWHHIKIRERKGPSQGSRMGLGDMCLQAQTQGQGYVLLPTEAWVMPAPSSKKPEEREFAVDSAHAVQEGFKLRRAGYPSKVQDPHNGDDSQRRSANKWGSTGVRSRSCSLRDGANTRWHACRPCPGQTLRRARWYLWVGQWSKATSNK